MKLRICMIVLLIFVVGLCIWDSVFSSNALKTLYLQSNDIYQSINDNSIDIKTLYDDVENLNDFWTKKMDILSISISRKDMMPISDYLQYLISAIKLGNQDDAVTYSRLLVYNVEGLQESTQPCFINLL